MGDAKEALQASIISIINTVESSVCKAIPEKVEENSEKIFKQVIEIISAKREELREQIMKDFKASINDAVMGDKDIQNMLTEILKEGVERVYGQKNTKVNPIGGNRTTKRKPNSKKYRKSIKKI